MPTPSRSPIVWLKVLTSHDAEFTRNLRNENKDSFHNHELITEEQHNNWMNKILKENPPSFHIIMLGSELIGTISVLNYNEIAEIGNVVIVEKYRRLGYGRQAMLIAMGLAVSRGANKLKLSVEFNNDEARDFYSRLGFEEKAIIMEKVCL